MRGLAVPLLFVAFSAVPSFTLAQTATDSQKTGAELYAGACATCHGPDGRGTPRSSTGFELDLPDFSDCSFATPEADADWAVIVHSGGRARAFNRMMPAFGDALSREEIGRILEYVRSFCTERGWPRGDLNLPRPLATEKAFPENEAVMTTTLERGDTKSVGTEFVYEHRLGRRGQWEAAVPMAVQQQSAGSWQRGLGDVAVAYKHVLFASLPRGSIVSAGSELILPTGKESEGLGSGATVFEPFAVLSQMLPRDGFLHLHAGVEIPGGMEGLNKEAYWRAAAGRTYFTGRWGRAWSPMLEVLGAREIEEGAPVEWDVVPQVQVSLSTRQHVLFNLGLRVPVTLREERKTSVVMYLLWDWFDGGLFSGW